MKKWLALLIVIIGVVIVSTASLAPSVMQFVEEPSKNRGVNAVAHVFVKGTPIDYTVYQHPTDDTYYLNHDGEGQLTEYGAIFMELVNASDLSDPMVILYGHAMRNGSMFGSLKYFLDSDYLKKHAQVNVTVGKEKRIYEVFAAYEETDEHLFTLYDFSQRIGVEHYWQQVEGIVRQRGGIYQQVFTSFSQILTLSTCDVVDNKRVIVQAQLKQVEIAK